MFIFVGVIIQLNKKNMRTCTFIRIVLLSFIVLFASCSKDEEVQVLSKSDLVGTWKTEYFEYSGIKGPLTAVFNDDNSYILEYYLLIDDNWMFEEKGTYTLSGNRLKLKSGADYQMNIKIEEFNGSTAVFNISNDDVSISVKATKQD